MRLWEKGWHYQEEFSPVVKIPLSPPKSCSGAHSLCAYPATASQVPDEVACVRHGPGQLLVPALQQAELRLQRLPQPPAGGCPMPTAGPRWPFTLVPTWAGRSRPVLFLPAASAAAWAVAAAAAGRAEGAALDVRRQLPQPHGVAAALRTVVALHSQLLDQVAQRQHPVQLARLQRLALQRAPAPPRRPGQQAAGAEDVPARRARGLLQHLAAQLAMESGVHSFREALQSEAHDSGGGGGEPKGVSASSEHPRGSARGSGLTAAELCGEVCVISELSLAWRFLALARSSDFSILTLIEATWVNPPPLHPHFFVVLQCEVFQIYPCE